MRGCWVLILVGVMLVLPTDAYAYIGPGSGLSAFGSLFAVLAAIFFAVVGFIWYPVKRVIRIVRLRTNGRPQE